MSVLKVGEKAPDFIGKNQNGEYVKLQDFKGKKLILYFYPKDNTPGCTSEACDLRDNYNMWLSKGYQVIGISPDSENSHIKFIEKYNLPFDLISDTEKTILKSYGAWGEKKMYGKTYEGVLRTTYIINENGIIEEVFTKVKTKEHTKQILSQIN
ncbi:MAG TPA: thioredoxin-dependent thiol peroxidase [Bacteroidales bacterium]|jgi:peroxiredoxin Q/BCP|nr:thioredoxin-dependent thiol peroxidase [Bacteroidales bacterium]MDD4235081.1 thioredoxin-dependent thiol peroxidase [Bacteroidales bacterium]HXK81223.1 thioredoxin-dependent thiol peroxidase [Bacteroidales bacterium]